MKNELIELLIPNEYHSDEQNNIIEKMLKIYNYDKDSILSFVNLNIDKFTDEDTYKNNDISILLSYQIILTYYRNTNTITLSSSNDEIIKSDEDLLYNIFEECFLHTKNWDRLKKHYRQIYKDSIYKNKLFQEFVINKFKLEETTTEKIITAKVQAYIKDLKEKTNNDLFL